MSKEKKIIKLTGKQLGKVCGGKVDFPNKIGTDGGCSKLVFSQCCQITVYLDTQGICTSFSPTNSLCANTCEWSTCRNGVDNEHCSGKYD